MTMRVSRFVRSVSTVDTGVAKSMTSRRRISSAAATWSLNTATTRPPSWRMSTGVDGSVRFDDDTRPPPSRQCGGNQQLEIPRLVGACVDCDEVGAKTNQSCAGELGGTSIVVFPLHRAFTVSVLPLRTGVVRDH